MATPLAGSSRGAGGVPRMPAAAPANTDKTLAPASTSPLVLEWVDFVKPSALNGAGSDNELAVWTGDGTIEGDANLTWDGSTLLAGGTEVQIGSAYGGAVTGVLTLGGNFATYPQIQTGGTLIIFSRDSNQLQIGANGTVAPSNSYFGFNSSTNLSTGSRDTSISRHAAGVLNLDPSVIDCATEFDTGLIVQSTDDNTDNPLIDCQNSGGTTVFKVDANGDVTVGNDFIVQGATHTTEATTVLIGDQHLYLNDGYTSDPAVTAGLVVNYDPTTTTDTVASGGFTAGVASTSNPTVITIGSATFSAGDLIQISGANESGNDGLFEVLTHTGTTLTINGVGLTATTDDFTQTQFTTDATVAGTITKVNVSVLRAGTDGLWEQASGSTSGFTFSNLTSTSAAGSDNELAVWNASGELEGDSNLTWDGTDLTVSTAVNVPIINGATTVTTTIADASKFQVLASQVKVATDLDPWSTNTHDLGSTDLRWSGLWAQTANFAANTLTDTALIVQNTGTSTLNNLIEFQDSGGNALNVITAEGDVRVGSDATGITWYRYSSNESIVFGKQKPTGSPINAVVLNPEDSNRPASNQSVAIGYGCQGSALRSVAIGGGILNTEQDTFKMGLNGSVLADLRLDGNHSITSTLDDPTLDEVALTLNYTTNKATSGNDTGLVINQTDTTSPGTSLLIDAQVGGVSKFSVDNGGNGSITGDLIFAEQADHASTPGAGFGYLWVKSDTPNTLYFTDDAGTDHNLISGGGGGGGGGDVSKVGTPADNQIGVWTGDGTIEGDANLTWDGATLITGGTYTASSGTENPVSITPTYNQTATAGGTDLLINRTETAVGSGSQLLIDAQVGGVSKFSVSNAGAVTTAAATATDTALTLQTTDDNTSNPLISCLDSAGTTEVFSVEADGNITAPGRDLSITAGAASSTVKIGTISGKAGVTSTGQLHVKAASSQLLKLGSGGFTAVEIINQSFRLEKGIRFTEIADHHETPAAGYGQLWVKNDTPNTLYFTDDAGTDHNLISGGGGGAFTADGDTQITPSTAIVLDHATNNEVALTLDYTTNKAAGNDTGLVINQTDTASPGTSLLIDAQVGGTTIFSVSNGVKSRFSVMDANKNTAFNGLPSLTTGSYNTAIGEYSLFNVTTGSHNIGIGNNNGRNNGNYNIAIGSSTQRTGGSGSGNVSVGFSSGYTATGNYNVSIGQYAGYTGTGSENAFLGYKAGGAVVHQSNCVGLGSSALRHNTSSNILGIDAFDRSSEAVEKTSSLIYGVFNATPANQTLTFNASVGISTNTPAAKLDVQAATLTDTGLIVQTTDDNTTNPLISCLDQAGTTEVFALEANGDATFTGKITSTDPTGGIGYGTGAGATVVQVTSKSTSVTISYVCGEITMNNASLAADTTVSFTMTNTTIDATDVLVLNHKSGGTAGAYTLNAQCGAGSATINVRNVTTGSLAEAIVLQFVVIKAVTS